MTTTTTSKSRQASAGGRLVAVDGRTLPLQGVRLEATARGGLARTVLEQRFRNPYPDPLHVTYLFPLPEDGAVSGFAFRMGETRVVGEVDRLAGARRRFEEAVVAGRTAALLEKDRSGLFTQELGNVPPGVEVVAELVIDQRLAWLPEGSWEYRFPTAVAPRYHGASADEDPPKEVAVADAPMAPSLTLSLTVCDDVGPADGVSSPSHVIAREAKDGAVAVTFAEPKGAPLDSDVVVRWRNATERAGLALATFRASAGRLAERRFGLLTVVPPAAAAKPKTFARDLIVLLDTSGSMSGRPLDQGRAVVAALLGAVRDADRLELICFANQPERWRSGPTPATAVNRAEALRWLQERQTAGGGTELGAALREALRPLDGEAQRQVIVVTDGDVTGAKALVAHVLRSLPARSQLHAVGVGYAPNRSILAPLARAGRGAEVLVGLDEDPSRAARALVARCAEPVVANVEVSGSAVVAVAVSRIADVYTAAPVLVPLELRPEGGDLCVRGLTPDGPFELVRTIEPQDPGTGHGAVAVLFARERVEECELGIAAGVDAASEELELERLGLDFQIATRKTSWLAVSETPTVDPGKPTRRLLVPQNLPRGMSADKLGIGTTPEPYESCTVLYQSAVPDAYDSRLEQSDDGPARGFRLYQSARVPPAPHRTAPTAAPANGMFGLVMLGSAVRIVIEVPIAFSMRFRPEEAVTVRLPDGAERKARLVKGASTAECDLVLGQRLRLVLEPWEAGTPWPPTVSGTVVEVDLTPGAIRVKFRRR